MQHNKLKSEKMLRNSNLVMENNPYSGKIMVRNYTFEIETLTYHRLKLAIDTIDKIRAATKPIDLLDIIYRQILANSQLSHQHNKVHTNITNKSGFFDLNVTRLSDALFTCHEMATQELNKNAQEKCSATYQSNP